MHKLVLTLLLVIALLPAMTQPLNPAEADSLRTSLRTGKRDVPALNGLLKLAFFSIGQPGELKTDLDSAAGYIAKAKQLNKELHSRTGEGYINWVESWWYREKGDRVTGKPLVQTAVQLLKNGEDLYQLGKAYFELSEYYDHRVRDSLLIKIDLVEKAAASFQQGKLVMLEANCLEVLGDLYEWQGNDAKAIEKIRAALKGYQSIGYTKLQGVYILYAGAYIEMGDFSQAVTYQLLALKAAQQTHDSSMQLCQINNYIGISYDYLGENDKAIPYFYEAMKVADRYHDTPTIRTLCTNITSCYLLLKRPVDAKHMLDSSVKRYHIPGNDVQASRLTGNYMRVYYQMGQMDKAATYCNRLLSYTHSNNLQPYDLTWIYKNAAKFYIADKQYEKAASMVTIFWELMKKVSNVKLRQDGFDLSFMLDTARRDYASAVRNLLQARKLGDSMISVTKNRQIEQLRIDYETSEKEKHILSLQEQGKLEQKALEQSRLTRNYSIAGAILLLLLLIVGFSRYRLKQQKNLELELKQEEITAKNMRQEQLLRENEWLLREVHHRVKNNLQVVMSLLNSQSAELQDEAALNAVLASQHRVQAMSLIHQKLYKSNNASTINMQEYIDDLVTYLQESISSPQPIYFAVEAEPIQLDVAQAVPVGLIVNEIVTNSIKYAFPQPMQGRITVKLHRGEADMIAMYVADNGQGLPPDYDPESGTSFGMRLIRGLVEDLEGTMHYENGEGLAYSFLFAQAKSGALPPTDSSSYQS